ncbi:MAG: hypothetical protein CMJ70_24925 [Planctomycetaceae bacterium]|nr:hypothetical protein [Planctomycetaceae bacterium]
MALFGRRAVKIDSESSQSPMSTGTLNTAAQGVWEPVARRAVMIGICAHPCRLRGVRRTRLG